jgi:2-methylisocitrate lyase-like PEP mutase family enzyme
MGRDGQKAGAERLRALHHGPDPLVLVNAWDAVSARIVQEVGFPAVATSSAAVAASLGYPDGQRTPIDEMLAAVARIAAVTSIPLTADMEAGYGLPPDRLARRLIDAGAVGLNLEDSRFDGRAPLEEPEPQADRLAALKQSGRAAGVDLVLNARVDVFLAGVGEAHERMDQTLRRAAAYVAAGADCIFVPGVRDEEAIGALVRSIDAPVNILAGPGTPPVARLAELGVARISLGSAPARAALTLLKRLAEDVRDLGTYGAGDPLTLTHATVNSLMEDIPG